ncbi:cyclin, partial [Haematococcus lacustris]
MELDCLISGEHDWQEEQAARANESCELLTHPEEAPALLKAVAQVLLNAVEKAERVDRLTDNEDVDMATRLTPFHGAQPPAISLYDYLTRIARHAKMSPACFVVALMLIDEACTGTCCLAHPAEGTSAGPNAAHCAQAGAGSACAGSQEL